MYLLYLLAQLIKLKKTMKGLSRKHFINTDIVFWNIYKMLENFVMFLPISCCHQENEKKKNLHSWDISLLKIKSIFLMLVWSAKHFQMFSKLTILSDSHPTIIHIMPFYIQTRKFGLMLLFQPFLFINP